MTLIELLVSMMILGIAMVIFGTTLTSVQRGIVAQDQLSRANDQARLAMEQIDREMRSGNVLYNPASEGTSNGDTTQNYYMVRIYTQTNADTRAIGDDNGYRCVQWRVANEELQTRSWPPLRPDDATAWRTVAEGIVNKTSSVRAFELDNDVLKGNRVLNVTLHVSVDSDATPVEATVIKGAFTGRNTSYGFPVSVCNSLP
jgi:prepilin-type N-terminal cleavage/methylation domain-containing protein